MTSSHSERELGSYRGIIVDISYLEYSMREKFISFIFI